MMYLDVDTAITVPVNIAPLIDDTDFKSRETGVAYDAAGMDLVWNFITSAGVITQTAVTPTTAGDYDWSEIGDAMYKIEIPASGGASINNDAEGYGWFSGIITGILPFRGPTIGFRASGLNDALTDSAYSTTRGLAGTALPNAVSDAAGGLPISDAGGLDLDTLLDAAVSTRSSHSASDVVDNFETQSQADPTGFHVNVLKVNGTAQTAGDLSAQIDAVDNFVDTEVADIQSRLPAALTGAGYIKADALAIEGQSLDSAAGDNFNVFFNSGGLSDANWKLSGLGLGSLTNLGSGANIGLNLKDIAGTGYVKATDSLAANQDEHDATQALAAASAIRAAVGLASANLDTQLSAIDNFIDTEIATLQSDLDKVPKSDGSVSWNATALAAIEGECEDALQLEIPDSVPSVGSRPSVQQAVRIAMQALTAKDYSGTAFTVYKEDNSTTLISMTLNDATTPTAIVRAA